MLRLASFNGDNGSASWSWSVCEGRDRKDLRCDSFFPESACVVRNEGNFLDLGRGDDSPWEAVSSGFMDQVIYDREDSRANVQGPGDWGSRFAAQVAGRCAYIGVPPVALWLQQTGTEISLARWHERLTRCDVQMYRSVIRRSGLEKSL